MWYVIQVMSQNEFYVKDTIEKRINTSLLDECYVPMRRMKKKFQKRWNIVEEILFPGYVFINTKAIKKIFFQLKAIDAFTKILSDEKYEALPLSLEDRKILECLRGMGNNGNSEKKDVVDLSHVIIENNQVIIKDGPLKGLEGKVKKVNLHKRFAIVNMEFFGETREVHLGIDILEKV